MNKMALILWPNLTHNLQFGQMFDTRRWQLYLILSYISELAMFQWDPGKVAINEITGIFKWSALFFVSNSIKIQIKFRGEAFK